MLCDSCNKDFSECDFLLNRNTCFHCVYKQKIMVLKEVKRKIQKCKICSKDILKDENKKVRQRSIYCSQDCAEKAHKEQVENFWTNKINFKLTFR